MQYDLAGAVTLEPFVGDGRPVVVDTGYHPDYVAPEWAHGKQFIEPPKLLAETGIKSDEIKTVIVTHFQQDHFTGFDYFPKAKFIIQRAELEFWTGPLMRHKILDNQIRPKVRPSLEKLKSEERIHLIGGPATLSWVGSNQSRRSHARLADDCSGMRAR